MKTPCGLVVTCIIALAFSVACFAGNDATGTGAVSYTESPTCKRVMDGVKDAIRTMEAAGVEVDAEKARRCAIEAIIGITDPCAVFVDSATAADARLSSTSHVAQVNPVLISEHGSNTAAYVKLSGLPKNGWPIAMAEIRKRLVEDGGSSLILDLRDADGDGWDGVPLIASVLAERTATESIGKFDRVASTLAGLSNPMSNAVIAVLLVNNKTGGAAELLAASVKNRQGVLVMGSPTKGDMNRRDRLVFEDGSELWITTRKMNPAADVLRVEPDIYIPDGIEADIMQRALDATAGFHILGIRARQIK